MTTSSLADSLLEQVTQHIQARTRFPESTYRLQFHAGFTFHDARQLVPYLHALGITHCYASPYLTARAGSQHGYDISDHRHLNPEIGTLEDYDDWVAELKAHGMEHILDTVPNHMGIVGNDNHWWNDVLENGPASPYADFFDISWYASPRPELRGRLLVPVLGEPYGKVLEAQQLQLKFAEGTFSLNYFDHRFPVAPRSYAMILSRRIAELEQALGPDSPAFLEYQSILTAVGHLPHFTETEPTKIAEHQREKIVIKRRLNSLCEGSPVVQEFIGKLVQDFNGRAGEPRSFDLLDILLDDQAYRLSFWRVAADEINYRRFFDVNELAALSMERPDVFAATHELILKLLVDEKLTGLRIDHPDGLYDPRQYLERLQRSYVIALARKIYTADPQNKEEDWAEQEASIEKRLTQLPADSPLIRPLFVSVEKILGTNEALPTSWPVHGTSGYDALNAINGVFVKTDNASIFTSLYHDLEGVDDSFAELVYRCKSLILQVALSSELQMLTYQLDRLAQKNRWSRDFTFHSLRRALREVIAAFPVYRSYIADEVDEADRKHVRMAVSRALARNPAVSGSLFHFVRDMLLLEYHPSATDGDRAEQRRFVGKFQQVTAPVMAKGQEDTACYVYNRLLSLNEVGGDPARFGIEPDALHDYFQSRQSTWPHALSPLSTHDTKRSADVRARLNVLSEMPTEWEQNLARWRQLNEAHKTAVDEQPAPDANEECFLYQTLLGAWPLDPYTPEQFKEFIRRIQEYMVKALHEAKVHTSWINPNAAYDEAMQKFITAIMDEEMSPVFLKEIGAFQRRVAHYGMVNSLAQTVLQIAGPGIPDIYQGTETWDFSLADPDNRRPVDYVKNAETLKQIQSAPLEDLTSTMQDGRIKLLVTSRALACRREHPGLFSTGEYIPLEVVGSLQQHVFAFLRHDKDATALVVVPRLLSDLRLGKNNLPAGELLWGDTSIRVPEGEKLNWKNVLSGDKLPGDKRLSVGDLLKRLPVGLFVGEAGK